MPQRVGESQRGQGGKLIGWIRLLAGSERWLGSGLPRQSGQPWRALSPKTCRYPISQIVKMGLLCFRCGPLEDLNCLSVVRS